MATATSSLDRLAYFLVGAVLLLLGVGGYAGLVPLAVGPIPQALAALLVAATGVVILVVAVPIRR